MKDKILLICEVIFWIPIWIFAGAWCSVRDGLKDAIDSWRLL